MNDDCVCGKPLHYRDLNGQRIMEHLVSELGPDVAVEVADRKWMVPRHYIALHGLRATELPTLAQRYGFAEVSRAT